MNSLIPNLLGIAFSSWLGAGAVKAPRDAVYQCQDPQWTSGPTVTDGEFHGTVAVDCTFTGTGGDGYSGLQQYLVGQATQAPNQVNDGPTTETYDGLPSVAYDITTQMQSGGSSVTAQGTVHFATDGKAQLVTAFASSQIQGEGEAQYIQEIDTSETISNGQGSEQFAVHSETALVVEKPGLIPVQIFQNKVTSEVESAIPGEEKTLMEQITGHI
jgi:hypothetical protein